MVPSVRTPWRLSAAVSVLGCLMLSGPVGRVHAFPSTGEYELKAAFLVNFGGFVRWPLSAFEDGRSPFAICIFGDDPFGDGFEPFRNRTVAGRPLEVRSPASPEAARQTCHVLFIAGSAGPRIPEILRELNRAAILTVSDLDDFAGSGGMIQLFIRDKKIHFTINRDAAGAAGLKIDARLLKLAEPGGVLAGEQRR